MIDISALTGIAGARQSLWIAKAAGLNLVDWLVDRGWRCASRCCPGYPPSPVHVDAPVRRQLGLKLGFHQRLIEFRSFLILHFYRLGLGCNQVARKRLTSPHALAQAALRLVSEAQEQSWAAPQAA